MFDILKTQVHIMLKSLIKMTDILKYYMTDLAVQMHVKLQIVSSAITCSNLVSRDAGKHTLY